MIVQLRTHSPHIATNNNADTAVAKLNTDDNRESRLMGRDDTTGENRAHNA